MKAKVLNLNVLILILTICTYSCDNNDASNDAMKSVGKGVGMIEFKGKTYPLNACSSYKMTSWYPPPLGIYMEGKDTKSIRRQ